jgi:hypothetical protein
MSAAAGVAVALPQGLIMITSVLYGTDTDKTAVNPMVSNALILTPPLN